MKNKSSRAPVPQAGPRSLLEPLCLSLPALARERREKLGLSIKEVARRARLSYQAVSLVERSRRVPGLDTVARLGQALGWLPWQFVRAAERRAGRG